MIELVKISENISRQFDGQETVDNLQAVNYRIVENGVEKMFNALSDGSDE